MPIFTMMIGLVEHQPSLPNNDCYTINEIKAMREALLNGKDIYCIGENLTHKQRRGVLDGLRSLNVTFIADLYIGEVVNIDMIKRFAPPYYNEGFTVVNLTVLNPSIFEDTFETLQLMDQEHPNHSLTIGVHCREVANLLAEQTQDEAIITAGLMHDIGKMDTKKYKESGVATYHDHHSVGAYRALSFLASTDLNKDDQLRASVLIAWHMIPKMVTEAKGLKKIKKFLGDTLWEDLMLLHRADIKAR